MKFISVSYRKFYALISFCSYRKRPVHSLFAVAKAQFFPYFYFSFSIFFTIFSLVLFTFVTFSSLLSFYIVWEYLGQIKKELEQSKRKKNVCSFIMLLFAMLFTPRHAYLFIQERKEKKKREKRLYLNHYCFLLFPFLNM